MARTHVVNSLVSAGFQVENGYDGSTRKDGPRLVTEGLTIDLQGVGMAVPQSIHPSRSVR